MDAFLTITDASCWASERYERIITKANITYLITYGRVRSVIRNGRVMVDRDELKRYYDKEYARQRELLAQLHKDMNRRLAFSEYTEKERTKHVHRLHPYKGKFIPQLVEYFLDSHTDEFKREVYFQPGDIVLDPFCGSGTTLVQASELSLHALGFDVSEFNVLITNTKIHRHDLTALTQVIHSITKKLMTYYDENGLQEFDAELSARLAHFNAKHFPSPEFKLRVRRKEVNPRQYGVEKSRLFRPQFVDLRKKYDVNLEASGSSFLDKWYVPSIRAEIDFISSLVREIEDIQIRNTIWVILSRTIRSARATTHIDLATLKEPVYSPYYCRKHLKICKPLFTLTTWWKRYSDDAIRRFAEYAKLRRDTLQFAICGDSRAIPFRKLLHLQHPELAALIEEKKIAGIFTSPPYVGMIDYHEQHAYAYELLGIERQDEAEIGPLFKGKGREAQLSYVKGIADVLRHCKQYFVEDYNVFLVANDRSGLYPQIAELSGMRIVNQFERPVLRRSEFDQSAYFETIFHMREK